MSLMTFDFESHAVRSVMRDGEPWFAGKDVCTILDITDHNQALNALPEDERGGYEVPTPRGSQAMLCVNEPGLYRLIFKSRKEAAKRFKRWVVHEVLPSIRKTGRYEAKTAGKTIKKGDDGYVFGVRLSKIGAAAALLNVVHRIYGPDEARRLYESEPDLPKVTGFSLIADDDDTLRVPEFPDECLKHLMRMACGNGRTVADWLRLAFHDTISARKAQELGINVAIKAHPGMVGISLVHDYPKAAFRGTKWERLWADTLLLFPRAKTSLASFEGVREKALLLPGELVRALL